MALLGKSAQVVKGPPESLRQWMQWQWVRQRGNFVEVKEVLEQRQLPLRRVGGRSIVGDVCACGAGVCVEICV
ncbi:hypothetical protein I7I53_07753 [Histoplasma capsulatum var. duboisii H88]|uniref:Uncharacterized protein n=1 Tax=Ajellomyces capsulatus (strain H88) TaxID=544711 RepID=A0A8A1LHS1_AJEC8|nr:hypothetical protein I7I53_07753 [Histoplasma capsulatum var. duboisii H88]